LQHATPIELYPLVTSIEQATVSAHRAYPRMTDKDVEAVYDQYRAYFQAVRQGKDPTEPSSTLAHRERLLEEIWNTLLAREAINADQGLLEGDWTIAGRPPRDLEEIYLKILNDLRKSVRFWRKRGGPRGYLTHIAEHTP
jgi:hypothetical protein